MAERYSNVEFEFLTAADKKRPHLIERGVVLVRDGEMVLEVDYNGDTQDPYVVCGTAERGFFHGRHKGRVPDDVAVEAKWTKLDDVYIGMWTEDGTDYFFRFRLTAKTTD